MTDPRQTATLPAARARPAFNSQLVTALLVLLLGCLAGTGWLTYRLQRTEIASELWERKTRVVIQEFGDLLSSLKDAETGQRGFIITGKPDYLEPYQASLSKIANSLADLRRLTADNPRQQQRLVVLTPLVAARLEILKVTIALRETQGFPVASAALMALPGKTIMDEIRVLMAQAEADETQLLQERVATHAMDNHRTLQSVTLGSILAGLALLLLFICLRRELVRRHRAETVLQLSEQRLRLATDAAELGIWSWQPDGDRISWENDKSWDVVGIPRTDAPINAARFAANFVHPEDLAAFETALQYTLQHGTQLFYQGRFHHPDGGLRWIEFTGQPVDGSDGLRVTGTMRNITERKQAEQALRQSEAFSRSIIKSSPDCIKVLDLAGNLLSMESGHELLGIEDIRPFLNTSWLDFWIIEDDRRAAQAAVTAAAAGGAARFVGYFRTLRGEPKWWDVLLSPISGTDGKPAHLLAVSRDVTQRQQAEADLRASEERVGLALDAAELGTFNIELPSNTLTADARFRTIFGFASGEIDYEQAFATVHPEDRPAQRDAVAAATRIDAPVPYATEYRVVHPDGAIRWVSAKGRANFGAGEGVTRKLLSFDGTVADITERKQAEEALRQSDERFRALLNSGSVAIYSCDRAGKILEINRAAIDLWGSEPKPGETDAQFRGAFKSMRPDGSRLPYAETWMTRVLNGEIVAARNQESSNERPDGSRTTVIVNVVPLKNAQGEIAGAINCFYDITERSRLERETLEQAQALAELDRRKDEFLAMLSHELRNPLAALSNAVQLLRQHKHEEPLLLQGRSIIERQLGQLKHLVDDLLEVSRINSGSVRLRQQTVSISGMVERALETAQPLITQHRHQLTLALPPEPIFLHADTARLEQVLVNLLTNAAKYTDAGGHIWLSVEQEDDAVVLRVRDSGIGIEPALLPHIFDLFTQAERSLDRAQGGLGIGLSLVRRLVELHGGSVEAHSVLGQGSEFVVRLPLLPLLLTALPESSPAPASASTVPSEKASSRCRVLVVDDNVDAAQSMAKLLEMTSHEARLAYDGTSALQAAIDYRPDVVLLDIGLPGLDGYEVAERIRQHATLKHTVLVALTGYGQDTDRQRSQDAGFDHHLVKPSDFDEIKKILAGVILLRKS